MSIEISLCSIYRFTSLIWQQIHSVHWSKPWLNSVPWPWYGYVWNVHRMTIKIEHRNLETRKTRNDFSVQVRNFLLPLSLKVFWHKEREAQSFYSGFFIAPPTKVSASKRKPTVFPWGRSHLNSDFFKISQNLPRSSGAWRHPHSITLLPMGAIVTSLSDTSALPPCACVNTCVNVAPK